MFIFVPGLRDAFTASSVVSANEMAFAIVLG